MFTEEEVKSRMALLESKMNKIDEDEDAGIIEIDSKHDEFYGMFREKINLKKLLLVMQVGPNTFGVDYSTVYCS